VATWSKTFITGRRAKGVAAGTFSHLSTIVVNTTE
jgi:hypothetical protein